MDFLGKTVLITGGTGSFGKACVRTLLERHDPKAIRVFSRDELKQSELQAAYADESCLRFLIGDVRDLDRLRVATRDVDIIVHAAALKQIVLGEFNPFEVTKTNILGAQNVATAAIDNHVRLVVALSSDKAVAPTNLYGASKLLAERIFAQAGVYSGNGTRFASVRYGNVVGSRGSVIPVFRKQREQGMLTITDPRMTRFWITLQQAVDFTITSAAIARDGDTFVPKIPSAKITDLADVIAPEAGRVITGIRPGEKLHECLLTEDEARGARDLGDRYVILPHRLGPIPDRGEPLPDGFRYTSDTNPDRLTASTLRELLAEPVPVP
jgi:UDP-N-acetylglucosamine 4,6-dehydratase/5-epimerase